jgi:hypothetical protein
VVGRSLLSSPPSNTTRTRPTVRLTRPATFALTIVVGAADDGPVIDFGDEAPIPARPAIYVRDRDATTVDDVDATFIGGSISEVTEELGWPEPAVYADAGPTDRPGTGLAALAAAITAGQVDGVFAAHPSQFGDLAEIEAFDRLSRQHGVLLRFRWFYWITDTRALFDVVRTVTEFTVTDDHLRLLRRAYVHWNQGEFGAPSIDSKRPYGNSNVFGDIAEILGIPESEWADEDLSPSVDYEWRFLRLHVGTAVALQIALETGEFRTGRYTRGRDWDDRMWRRS